MNNLLLNRLILFALYLIWLDLEGSLINEYSNRWPSKQKQLILRCVFVCLFYDLYYFHLPNSFAPYYWKYICINVALLPTRIVSLTPTQDPIKSIRHGLTPYKFGTKLFSKLVSKLQLDFWLIHPCVFVQILYIW